MRLTFLGTGTSFGVPQVGCGCAVCRSTDPRDRRTRTGAVLEVHGTRLLIDAPPELRLQLVACGIASVDAVLFTHAHADHVAGIDDLRAFSLGRPGGLPAYGPPETLARLREGFTYIFDAAVVPVPGTSKPELTPVPLAEGRPVRIGEAEVLPLAFPHGGMRVFGYRVGPVAYLTDVKAVPDTAAEQLRGLDVLVLNALWWRSHPTHLSIDEAVEVARALGARRTYLTHLTHETSHASLLEALPDDVTPAHDGLVVEVDG